MASTLLLIDRIYIFDKNSNFFQDSTVKWGAPSLKPRQIGLYKLFPLQMSFLRQLSQSLHNNDIFIGKEAALSKEGLSALSSSNWHCLSTVADWNEPQLGGLPLSFTRFDRLKRRIFG
jgi:hypothetical protein